MLGSWCECLRDGHYLEYRIDEDLIMLFTTQHPEFISFYKSRIHDSLLIHSGINVSVFNNNTDTLIVLPKPGDKLFVRHTASTEWGFELRKLNVDIPGIDSVNLDKWTEKSLRDFIARANCPDQRTEEEKNQLIELGEIEDHFEDLITDSLPDWAQNRYAEYEHSFPRSYQLFPSFLESDFMGDMETDIAIFVSNKSSKKKGILFLSNNTDQMLLAGAGNSIGSAGDDFSWAETWKVFDERIADETTFESNGEISGSRIVKLGRPAISISQTEGAGGLIYFDGQEFVWIHRSD
jgi:hypothetical protein